MRVRHPNQNFRHHHCVAATALWDSQRQPYAAQIGRPGGCSQRGIRHVSERLLMMQQPDRIAIDECHVLRNQQKLRPSCQMVLLNATLPPTKERQLWLRM